MNAQETLALLEALRAAGATHFKSQDFEVTLGQAGSPSVAKISPAPTPSEAPKENPEATAKLKELIETMKLDDATLLDRIFPAGAGG